MCEKNEHKKPAHGKVSPGQMALLPEEMGYDICELEDSRHEVFCREFAVHENRTRAYLKAFPGCSKSTARANGSALLTRTDIAERVRQIRDKRMEKLEITHQKILAEVAKLAFLNPQDFYDEDGNLLSIQDMDPHTAAAIEGVKIKREKVTRDDEEGETVEEYLVDLKYGNKKSALELLMRHKEMLPEVVTHGGVVGVTNDAEKFDALRNKFKGGANGGTSPAGTA